MKRLVLAAIMLTACGTEPAKREVRNHYVAVPVPVYVQPTIQVGECIAAGDNVSYVVMSVGYNGVTIKKLLHTPLFSCINPLYGLNNEQLRQYRKVLCPVHKFY